MKAGQLRGHRLGWFSPIFCLLLGFAAPSVSAQESYCAEVKIEIKQELTLERQAFDAHKRINNGLDTLPLDNVAITVNFTDENGNPVLASSEPNNATAKFFIRIDTLEGISDPLLAFETDLGNGLSTDNRQCLRRQVYHCRRCLMAVRHSAQCEHGNRYSNL